MHVVILVGKRVSSTMNDKQKFPCVMTSVCINGEALVLGQLGGNSCEERGMELGSIQLYGGKQVYEPFQQLGGYLGSLVILGRSVFFFRELAANVAAISGRHFRRGLCTNLSCDDKTNIELLQYKFNP